MTQEEKSEYNKKYYQLHKEEYKERSRKYIKTEKYKQIRNNYVKNNPEKVKDWNRKYYLENLESHKEYYSENSDRIRKRVRSHCRKKMYNRTGSKIGHAYIMMEDNGYIGEKLIVIRNYRKKDKVNFFYVNYPEEGNFLMPYEKFKSVTYKASYYKVPEGGYDVKEARSICINRSRNKKLSHMDK